MNFIRNKGLFFGFVINALIILGLGWISFARYRIIEEIQVMENNKRDAAYLLQNTLATINGIGNQAKGYAFTKHGSYLLDLNQDVIKTNIRRLEHTTVAGNAQKSRLTELDKLSDELIKLNFRLVEITGKGIPGEAELLKYGERNTQLIYRTYQVAGEIQESETTSYNAAIADKTRRQRNFEVLGWILLFTAVALLFIVYFIINFYFRVRKQAELSLAQNKSLLQSVIDNSSNAVFIKQVNGHYLLVNKRFERLINHDHITGKTDYEIMPHDLADRFRNTDLEVIKNEREIKYEEEFLHNGDKHTYLMVKFPIRDERNKVYAIGCIATDITEHKIHDAQLKESEAQITTIFSSGPDAIIAINEQGNVLRWNKKAEELFKYNAEEVMGKPMHELIMPERFHELHLRGMKHFLKTGEGPILNKSIEVSAVDKNKREFEIELTVSFSRVNDKFIFIAFAREITNRKKLERDVLEYKNFLFSIIQNMPDLVFVKDAKTLNYVLVNPASEKFIGLPRNEILGKNNYSFDSKADADTAREKDMEAIQKGMMTEIPEEAVETKYGKRWLHTKKIPIMDEVGKPKFLLGISHDITERKKLENERNRAERQLRENEERMAMILENIGEGVVVANPENKVVLSNLMAEDIFETDRIDTIDWSEEWNIYYPDGKTIFPAQKLPLERALRGEISDMEIVLQNPETQKKKLLQVTGRPIRNEKGEVVAAVATIKDITRFKKLEKALEESRKLIGFGRHHHEIEAEKVQEKEREEADKQSQLNKQTEEVSEEKEEAVIEPEKKSDNKTELKPDQDKVNENEKEDKNEKRKDKGIFPEKKKTTLETDKTDSFDIHRLPPPDKE